jgi:hypothetical protein
VTPLARNAIGVYVALLLLLALVGALSQTRFRQQARLLADKESGIVALTVARAAAANVNGPRAITQWARQSGMVPAPDAARVEWVAAGLVPPEARPLPTPKLEVVTVWR